MRSVLATRYGAARKLGTLTLIWRECPLASSSHRRGALAPSRRRSRPQQRPPLVILKPNQYFQNFVNFGTDHSIRSQGAIYLPYADSHVSNIDTRDIGEIAARILCEEPSAHAGREYVLTGGTAHTMSELAESLSTVLGKPVQYVAIPEESARQGMTQAGRPKVLVESILGWFEFCRAGRAARIDPAAARLLGRPPRVLADFVRDYAHRYRD